MEPSLGTEAGLCVVTETRAGILTPPRCFYLLLPTPHPEILQKGLVIVNVSGRYLHAVIICGSESFPTKKADAQIPVSLKLIAYC